METTNKTERTDYVVTKKQEKTLTCEWNDCKEVYSDMMGFLDHLEKHIQQLFPEGTKFSNVDDIPLEADCQWRGCSYDINTGVHELLRHIYFHGFHIMLKSIGISVTLGKKLKDCMLEATSRNMIPELPERFHCGWKYCTTVSDNAWYFYRHVKGHAEEYPKGHKSFACKCHWEGCGLVLTTRYRLIDHLRSHTQEKVVACPTCGSLFASTTKYVDHLKRQADITIQNYQCSHCSKRFSSERLLRDHMRRHVNNYKCPFCEMTTTSPSTLRQHIKYRHSDVRDFHCPHCSSSFKAQRDLNRHIDTLHGDDFQYKCTQEKCHYRTKHESNMKSHMRNKHNEVSNQEELRYKCDSCDTTYTRGRTLTLHMMKRHNFQWPPGHRKFRYKLGADGHYHLQTVRYESYELSQQLHTNRQRSALTENNGEQTKTSRTRKGTKNTTEYENNNTSNYHIEVYPEEWEHEEEALDLSSKSRNEKVPAPINIVPRDADGNQIDAHADSYNLEMLGEVALTAKAREERATKSKKGLSGDILDSGVTATSTPLPRSASLRKGQKNSPSPSGVTPKRISRKRRKSITKQQADTNLEAKENANREHTPERIDERPRKRKRKDDSPTKLLRNMSEQVTVSESVGHEVESEGVPRTLQFVTEEGKVLYVQTDTDLDGSNPTDVTCNQEASSIVVNLQDLDISNATSEQLEALGLVPTHDLSESEANNKKNNDHKSVNSSNMPAQSSSTASHNIEAVVDSHHNSSNGDDPVITYQIQTTTAATTASSGVECTVTTSAASASEVVNVATAETAESQAHLQMMIQNSDTVLELVQDADNEDDDDDGYCNYYTVLAENSDEVIGLVSSKTGEYTPLAKGEYEYLLRFQENPDIEETPNEMQESSTSRTETDGQTTEGNMNIPNNNDIPAQTKSVNYTVTETGEVTCAPVNLTVHNPSAHISVNVDTNISFSNKENLPDQYSDPNAESSSAGALKETSHVPAPEGKNRTKVETDNSAITPSKRFPGKAGSAKKKEVHWDPAIIEKS